ncbi:hypothetical protein GPALN_003784 [Globodera pallida]|nr:hypothetical protein GPALN_003784 [Globodera pallida]
MDNEYAEYLASKKSNLDSSSAVPNQEAGEMEENQPQAMPPPKKPRHHNVIHSLLNPIMDTEYAEYIASKKSNLDSSTVPNQEAALETFSSKIYADFPYVRFLSFGALEQQKQVFKLGGPDGRHF